jgi:hypothetical protein
VLQIPLFLKRQRDFLFTNGSHLKHVSQRLGWAASRVVGETNVPLHRPARRTADSLEELEMGSEKKLARELVALVSSVSSAKFDNPLSFDQNPHGSVDFLMSGLRCNQWQRQ